MRGIILVGLSALTFAGSAFGANYTCGIFIKDGNLPFQRFGELFQADSRETQGRGRNISGSFYALCNGQHIQNNNTWWLNCGFADYTAGQPVVNHGGGAASDDANVVFAQMNRPGKRYVIQCEKRDITESVETMEPLFL